MSTKHYKSEPDIGLSAQHPLYGYVTLRDRIDSITNIYWIVEDTNDELHIADVDDLSDYHYYA